MGASSCSSCGDLCHSLQQDKHQIVQIEVTPRYDAVEWIKEQQTTGPFPITAKPSQKVIEHYDAENPQIGHSTNYPRQLIQWDDDPTPSMDEVLEVPVVETKIEENHLVVPTNLVKQRISDKLKTMIKSQLSRSHLEDSAKWYLLPSGNYFSGQLKNSVAVGKGIYILPGKVFFGEIFEGKPQGMGMILSQQYMFKGQFEEGKAAGIATLESPNYNVKGAFREGLISNGKMVTQQFEYEGQFLDGKPSGRGTYKNLITNTEYRGQFANGKYHGQGIYICPQYTYKGGFQNGLKSGKGTIEYAYGQSRSKSGIWDQDYFVRQAQ